MLISYGMTYALCAALLALSVREAIAPRTAARSYGVPIPDAIEPTPYLEVKANRDLVLAGLLVVAASAGHTTLALALCVGAIAPLADAFIVKRHGALSGTVIHLGTTAYLFGTAILAIAGH